jgi:hypothetical protein
MASQGTQVPVDCRGIAAHFGIAAWGDGEEKQELGGGCSASESSRDSAIMNGAGGVAGGCPIWELVSPKERKDAALLPDVGFAG